jgi:3-hydroxyacyl-[acyl-carrier-protein] dehydratase
MPPRPLINLETTDLTSVIAGPEEIRRYNPQRYEMEHLDGILHVDLDDGVVVGFKDVHGDEFWVRGHIPGRPLLPGVIMCEAAAQLCSYCYHQLVENDLFLGFGGMEGVKFRRAVLPGCRLILVCQCEKYSPRRASFNCQGFVDGNMVFEAKIVGMPM